MLKGLLRGAVLPRPLFLPIVFSLGAKVENVPLRVFLGNATKISNSMKQIRGHLRSDGVACYFDPYLEAETLGAVLHWQAEDKLPLIQWPQHAEKGELPDGLWSPEDAAKSGRVNVAVEAIRRLKSLLRDEPLLMAGVTGPFTLAAWLTGLQRRDSPRREDFPESALELAAATITQIASKLVEAGANVIFIQESILPRLSAEQCEGWASSLAPAINIVRFYEALPVLQISNSHSFAENRQVISEQTWDCIICLAIASFESGTTEIVPPALAKVGIALPVELFEPHLANAETVFQNLRATIRKLHPAIVTTASDVPVGTDIKLLAKVWEAVQF
jgi:uroporphyrinogen-III decarboxylase